MIERDRRDDGERRALEDVRRVEAAAEPDLEQEHVGRVLGEGEERRRRRDLELGDVVVAVARLRAGQHVDQRVLADRVRLAAGAGELDALVEAHQMRRGVDVHARARGLEHGLEIGRHRALAVGAGDVHARRQAFVGIAELAEQPLDAAERKIDQQRMQQLHFGEELGARRHVGLSSLALLMHGPARGAGANLDYELRILGAVAPVGHPVGHGAPIRRR